MKSLKALGDALKTVAPAIATAVAGPAGPLAIAGVKALSTAIGAPAGTRTESLLKSLTDGEGVDLTALRRADEAFRLEHEVELRRLETQDRASARKMRIALGGDRTSAMLAYAAVGMFGGLMGLVGWMAVNGTAITSDMKELIIFMLGHASGFVSSVYLFFYGASKSSNGNGKA